jgi:protein PET100
MFPIGFMYYFGINLDSRFAVPDFWPQRGQTHEIPFERDEILRELDRLKRRRLEARERRLRMEEEEERMRRNATVNVTAGRDGGDSEEEGEKRVMRDSRGVNQIAVEEGGRRREYLAGTRVVSGEGEKGKGNGGWFGWGR